MPNNDTPAFRREHEEHPLGEYTLRHMDSQADQGKEGEGTHDVGDVVGEAVKENLEQD